MGDVWVRRFALLAVLTSLAACSGTSPTEPDPLGTNVIRFNDAGGQLRDHEAGIRRLLTSTLSSVTELLPLTGVTITVIPNASRAIPGRSVGGSSPNAATVEIYVNPGFPNLGSALTDHLPSLAAHELHHAKRWAGPGYGSTLLEAMVSEGLADHFSIEHTQVAVPPWSNAFPRDETARYLELARAEFDSTAYDHQRWFFGPSPPLPRWTGYTLGFRLVETYLAGHPGATAAQLVNTPANVFRP